MSSSSSTGFGYGFSDSDVTRRLSSLGLGRPPGLQNTATLGTAANPHRASSPLANSTSSSFGSMMMNNSSQQQQNNNNNNNNSHHGSFSRAQSDSLMKMAQHNRSHNNTNGMDAALSSSNGRPPIAPASVSSSSHHYRPHLQAPSSNNDEDIYSSPDPERRTFSPPENSNNRKFGNNQSNSSNGNNNIFSPEASTAPRNNKSKLFEHEDGRLELVNDDDDDDNNAHQQRDNNINNDTVTPSKNQQQQHDDGDENAIISPQQRDFALYSVNWPVLVEVLNATVEKLNCQLSLVDSVIANPSGILPEREEEENNNNNNNSSKNGAPSVSSLITSNAWCKTLQQHSSETLEMIEYNLRHSSFGIKDVSSRLSRQLEQLKNDLGVINGEARELDDILRKEMISGGRNNNRSSNNNNNSSSSSRKQNTNANTNNTSPIDLWANGYLQRLSVAHDLTHRILFESAKFITQATSLSLSPDNNNNYSDSSSPTARGRMMMMSSSLLHNSNNTPHNSRNNKKNQASSSSSPIHYSRYHEGVSLLDNIDPKKALISSDLLLASCEQYARCCLMEYEKRMRERYELYARANFVELNVIIPMTSQVASMQLSLDEKESNLRLAGGRAGRAEQRLHEARIEFSEKEEKMLEEIAQLKKQKDVLVRKQQGGSGYNSNNNLGTSMNTTDDDDMMNRTVDNLNDNVSSSYAGNGNNNNNNSTNKMTKTVMTIPLSAHQEEAIARGKRINLSQQELINDDANDASNGGSVTDHEHEISKVYTPRTKSYMKKYQQQHHQKSSPKTNVTGTTTTPPPTDLSHHQVEYNSNREQQQQQQQLTPGSAEMMMEQVRLELSDKFSSEAQKAQFARESHNHMSSMIMMNPAASDLVEPFSAGRRTSGNNSSIGHHQQRIESPLQKLARMSSPMTPSSVTSNNYSSSPRGSSPIRETRASVLRAAKISSSSNDINNTSTGNMSVRSPRTNIATATKTTPRKTMAIFDNSTNNNNSNDDSSIIEVNNNNSSKMLDAANEKISQQIQSAKSSFNAMKEKYGGASNNDKQQQNLSSSSGLVLTPRGSSLGLSSSSSTKNQQQQQKGILKNQPVAKTTRHAHFDTSVVFNGATTPTEIGSNSPQVTAVTEYSSSSALLNNNGSSKNNSLSSSSSSTKSKLATLEQLVLEQRSELSTFKAHLKGIEQQETQVIRKRETIAQSLKQSQSSIDEVSEDELRDANDRISLVWAKIEEAQELLSKNKREVLAKMDLLSRTLRNSEREYNKARMEYARE